MVLDEIDRIDQKDETDEKSERIRQRPLPRLKGDSMRRIKWQVVLEPTSPRGISELTEGRPVYHNGIVYIREVKGYGQNSHDACPADPGSQTAG